MQIVIQARDIKVTKALRAHVELRLGLALSRFGERVGRVAVNLSNSEEHHSKPKKCCQIVLGLRRYVKVQETDADVFVAVDRAVDRAARSVAHAIEQEPARDRILSKPLDSKRTKKVSVLSLVAGRKTDLAGSSRLKRRLSSSPPRKSP